MDKIAVVWKSPSAIRNASELLSILSATVPFEHEKSLGLPTLRWNEPAYAFFSSPAVRDVERPREQGTPDCYWVVNAINSQMLLYARWSAMPFALNVAWQTVVIPEEHRTISQIKNDLAEIDVLLEGLAPSFFVGERGEDDKREHLRSLLTHHIPDVLKPQYRALTPDFFDWLES